MVEVDARFGYARVLHGFGTKFRKFLNLQWNENRLLDELS